MFKKIKALCFIFFLCFVANARNLQNFYKHSTCPDLKPLNIKTNSFKIADLKVENNSNSKIYLMVAGDTPVGIAVENCSYHYTFNDRYFLPVAIRNIKNALGEKLKPENGVIHLKDNAKWIFIWNKKIADTLSKKSLNQKTDFPEEVRKIFKGMLDEKPSMAAIYGTLFNSKGYTSVYIHSKKKRLFYNIDTILSQEEALYAIVPSNSTNIDFKNKYSNVVLTRKTLRNSWFDKDNPYFTVVDTKLNIFNDKDEHVIVTSTQRARINGMNIKMLVIPLINAKYSDRFRYYRVKELTVNGKDAEFIHDGSLLFIKLDKQYNAGDYLTFSVKVEGDIAIHPNGDNYFSLGTYPWYPQPYLAFEKSTFEITVKAPKPYSIFACGRVIEKGTEGNYNYLKTKLEHQSQFPVVAAGKYHIFTKDFNGYKCTVSSYAMSKEKHALRLANNFFVAEDFYSSLFGYKYPFKEQDIVEVNSWGFGQAPSGFIFITQEAFSPLRDYYSRFFSEGVNQRFVHEIAHTYWGHIAMIPNQDEMWISEALAQYSSALCIKFVHKNRKKGERVFKKMLKNWYAQSKLLSKGSVLFFAVSLSGLNARDYMDRWKLIYNKGPLVIHGIRMKLQKKYGKKEGDRKFVLFLRAILKNSDFDYIYTKDLIGILNAITKEDWTPYFEKYVLGTSIPEV